QIVLLNRDVAEDCVQQQLHLAKQMRLILVERRHVLDDRAEPDAEVSVDPRLTKIGREGGNPADAEENIPPLGNPITDCADMRQKLPQATSRADGMPGIRGVATKDLSGDRVELAAQGFENVRATVDHGFE